MTIEANWKASQNTTVCELSNGSGRWKADVDPGIGGDPALPNPHQLLDAALAACTTLTLQLYAKRRNYPVEEVVVTVDHEEASGVYTMKRGVTVRGNGLTQEALDDLLRVANRCPVHKTLSGQFNIETSLR